MAERPDPDTGHSEGCTSDMPLSMCQCDTPGWRPVPDPDWATLADRLGFMAQHPVGGYRNWNADLRAAADGLRQYAAITAAIGDPDELLADLHYGRAANGHGDDLFEAVNRIADAASLSPTPTPQHCPTCSTKRGVTDGEATDG